MTDATVATLTDQPTLTIRLPQPVREPRHGGPSARTTRRRRLLALATAIAAVVVTVAVVLVTAQSEPPPATGAAKLVPGDALLYLHLSTDRSRPAVQRALALVRRLPGGPLLSAAATGRLAAVLTGSAGTGVDSATQVRPWLGKEAAFALLDTRGSTAGSLIVLDVRNRAKASAFLAGAGAIPDGSYDGVSLLRERSGTELAFARHYLLLGQSASVQAGLDVARGHVSSLQANPAYQRAATGEPPDRVLDAYASVAGVRRVLAPRAGVLGALGLLLDQPALSGATVSASVVTGGVRLRIHEALYPTLSRVPGPRPSQFTPTLAGVLPSGSTMLLDVRDLARAAPRILAAAATAGIGGRIGPLLGRLGSALASEGVDIPQILSIFSGETAVAISPAGGGNGSAGAPALVIVARTSHQAATRRLLAGLEGPLAQLFPPPSNGAGSAPELGDVQVAGITAHQLALAPGFQLDYAVFRGLVVVSTSLRGIAGVARHAAALADTSGYQATLGNSPDRVTSLLFVDFSQLLSLGEQAGLMRGAQLAALRPDLERIRGVGLASTRGESDTTAELFLQIP